MVRKIVGALEKVGAGQKNVSWFTDLLRPELNHGAPTAPAEGLIHMDVDYQGLDWQVDERSSARNPGNLDHIYASRRWLGLTLRRSSPHYQRD